MILINNFKPLEKNFFDKPTLKITEELLGKYLVHETKKGIVGGKIVETESYLQNDPASHSFQGETKRNKSMFEKPGTIYVYFIYGIHFALNLVTGKKGVGEAVLIRAIEPIWGLDIMRENRGMTPSLSTRAQSFRPTSLNYPASRNRSSFPVAKTKNIRIVADVVKEKSNLTNGPGKLTKALGINKTHDRMSIFNSAINIYYPEKKEKIVIIKRLRIGIKKEVNKLYRFYINGNLFVSLR